MGYNTDFEGTLQFTTVLTAEMIEKLQSMFDEDCRDHSEWGEPDLTYINLELNDDRTGLEWNGQEKTYELDRLINVVIKEMLKDYPDFRLAGVLRAQGEDMDDLFEIFIGEDGLAHCRDLVAVPGETSVKCPHCDRTFQIQISE